MIEVQDLHKSFTIRGVPLHAVNGVSFAAADGEITGLLGPNGAGKTTTLRMLYTLMQPDRGRVIVDGLDAASDPTGVRARLGVLPDARGLYKRLSARENIEYFARLYSIPEAVIAARIEQAFPTRSTSATSSSGAPRGSRAGSARAPRSRARWSTIRGTCCSMSPRTVSTS